MQRARNVLPQGRAAVATIRGFTISRRQKKKKPPVAWRLVGNASEGSINSGAEQSLMESNTRCHVVWYCPLHRWGRAVSHSKAKSRQKCHISGFCPISGHVRRPTRTRVRHWRRWQMSGNSALRSPDCSEIVSARALPNRGNTGRIFVSVARLQQYSLLSHHHCAP